MQDEFLFNLCFLQRKQRNPDAVLSKKYYPFIVTVFIYIHVYFSPEENTLFSPLEFPTLYSQQLFYGIYRLLKIMLESLYN